MKHFFFLICSLIFANQAMAAEFNPIDSESAFGSAPPSPIASSSPSVPVSPGGDGSFLEVSMDVVHNASGAPVTDLVAARAADPDTSWLSHGSRASSVPEGTSFGGQPGDLWTSELTEPEPDPRDEEVNPVAKALSEAERLSIVAHGEEGAKGLEEAYLNKTEQSVDFYNLTYGGVDISWVGVIQDKLMNDARLISEKMVGGRVVTKNILTYDVTLITRAGRAVFLSNVMPDPLDLTTFISGSPMGRHAKVIGDGLDEVPFVSAVTPALSPTKRALGDIEYYALPDGSVGAHKDGYPTLDSVVMR